MTRLPPPPRSAALAGARAPAPRWRRALVVWALLCALVLFLGLDLARADGTANGFVLIVNGANPVTSVSRDFVADAFLKKATRWQDDQAIHPLDLRPNSQVRQRFSSSVLRRSVAAVRNYWQQRIFSGGGVPPPELESEEAVLRRVRQDRGAIGYVSEHADLAGAKVVQLR